MVNGNEWKIIQTNKNKLHVLEKLRIRKITLAERNLNLHENENENVIFKIRHSKNKQQAAVQQIISMYMEKSQLQNRWMWRRLRKL